jgi:hypothetical protein
MTTATRPRAGATGRRASAICARRCATAPSAPTYPTPSGERVRKRPRTGAQPPRIAGRPPRTARRPAARPHPGPPGRACASWPTSRPSARTRRRYGRAARPVGLASGRLSPASRRRSAACSLRRRCVSANSALRSAGDADRGLGGRGEDEFGGVGIATFLSLLRRGGLARELKEGARVRRAASNPTRPLRRPSRSAAFTQATPG